MRIKTHRPARGIALIIVMIVMVVFAILAGGFAYSMKVETRLAGIANHDPEFEWLGRSGVELARYVLSVQATVATEPYDSLNQKWAGGPGSSNTPLAEIMMQDYELGAGKFSVKIVDQERKYNINVADRQFLQQGLILVGIDAGDFPTIVDSVMDWIDTNDDPELAGAESDYYQSLQPPYSPKNGPIDDLTELLLIKGITPEMYYGSGTSNRSLVPRQSSLTTGSFNQDEAPSYPVGLADIFTPVSARLININTAGLITLQMIPEVDENVALAIIEVRSGPDGVDGTEDDTPFRAVTELVNVPGLNQQVVSQLPRFASVRSATFEVQVDVQIDDQHRTFVAWVRRNGPRDIPILFFYWK